MITTTKRIVKEEEMFAGTFFKTEKLQVTYILSRYKKGTEKQK